MGYRFPTLFENIARYKYLQQHAPNEEWRQWSIARWDQMAHDIRQPWAARINGGVHSLRIWANTKKNQVHPLDRAMLGRSGMSLPDAAAKLREVASFQRDSLGIWIDDGNSQDGRLNRAVVPRSTNGSWVKELEKDSVAYLLMQTIRSLTIHNECTTNPTPKEERDCTLKLEYLERHGGLVIDNGEAHRSFLRMAADGGGVESGDSIPVKESYTLSYRRWAGLSVPFGDLNGYPSASHAVEMFDGYRQDRRVAAISALVDFIAGLQANIINQAFEHMSIILHYWYHNHQNDVYRDELLRRIDSGETCLEGCSCHEDDGRLMKAMFCELDHISREAKLQFPGVEPSKYNAYQMAQQRKHLRLICTYQHRLVTEEENHNAPLGSNTEAPWTHYNHNIRRARRNIRRGVQLHAHDSQCFASGREVTQENFRGNDGHHLTEESNVELGQYVFVTKKYDQLSAIFMNGVMGDLQQFLESLFREVIVTRTLDSRLHMFWHWILSNRDGLKKAGFSFYYPFHKENGNLVYDGDDLHALLETLGGESLLDDLVNDDGTIEIAPGLLGGNSNDDDDSDRKPAAQPDRKPAARKPARQVTNSAETDSSSAVSPSSASSTIDLSSSTDEEGFVREEMDAMDAAISESIEDQIREASGRIRPRGDLSDSSDDEENDNGKSFKKLRKVGPARPVEPVPPRRPPPTPPAAAAQVQALPPPEGTATVDINDLNDGDMVVFLGMGLNWQRGTVRARPTNPFQRTPQLYIEYEVMVNSRRRNKAYTLQDTSIVRRQL